MKTQLNRLTINLFVIMASMLQLFSLQSFAARPGLPPTDPPVQYVQLADARIAYKVYGQGYPVILCTGYATNMDFWSTGLIDALKDKFKVVVFDYRGMGLSTTTSTSFSIELLAEDVNGLIDTLGIGKAHILGWSMGGFVAQMLAINHPNRVDKLVLYATNCGGTIRVDPSKEIVDILDNPKATPMERLSVLFPDDWLATHPEPWKYLPAATEPCNVATIGMQYMAIQAWLTPGEGSAGKLSKLLSPTLVICGTDDKVVPAANSTILADSIASASLVRILNTGHGFMYQKPDEFAAYVLLFLK